MGTMVGFDVSMGKSNLAIYNDVQECILTTEFEHSQTGFKWLGDLLNGFTDVKCVFESTGVYSKPLERFMKENGFVHYVLNPFEAKIKLNSTLRVHKTDKADANKLAQLLFKEKFVESFLSDSIHDQLRYLSRFYSEVQDQIDQCRNALHVSLQMSFPGFEKLFSSKSSRLFLQLVRQFPHPDYILTCSRTVLKNRIEQSTDKNISKNRLQKLAEKILTMAENCYPSVEKGHIVCDQAIYYAKRFEQLNNDKEHCNEKMIQLAQSLPEYHAILSIPALGPNTAARIISEVGDFDRFPSNKQLNAYAGIDIRRIQSGTIQIKDRMNKRGNPHLRKILFIIISNMIMAQRHYKNHIIDYYYKQKSLYNKCHRVAVVACMNKLLKTITYLIQNDTYYDYSLATLRK